MILVHIVTLNVTEDILLNARHVHSLSYFCRYGTL